MDCETECDDNKCVSHHLIDKQIDLDHNKTGSRRFEQTHVGSSSTPTSEWAELKVSTDKVNDRTYTDDDSNVDGPWSFVVGVASFMAQAFLGGYVYTGGIYYTVFTREFPEVSTVAISWLCTLPLMLWFLGSPVGSIMTNKLGCRVCAFVGGLMATIGLSLCFLATNFYLVFLFYGIISGLGFGIQYVGFVTAVSRYFNKYRTVVNILSTIGLTLGMGIYSYMIPYLITIFGWKGCLFVVGGISFNLCACACALFPFKRKPSVIKRRLFNILLLKRKYFLFLCFNSLCCNISNSMVILHLPSLILSYNLDSHLSSLALSLYAVSNGAAKIFLSFFGHVVNVNAIYIYTLFLTLCGVATTLTPVMQHAEWVLVLVSCIGFCYCVTGGHFFEVILELAGHDNFADGVGLGMVFKAVGALLAGPIAGCLVNVSGGFTVTFYTSGSVMVIGCLIMIPVILMKLNKSDVYKKEIVVMKS